jgi:DNA-binding GntR family transcriptional regulator
MDTKTKNDKAYVQLLEKIISGELQPKQRLVLSDLSEALGLSAMPIREALKRLEADGLVTQVPRHGARVAGLSYDDMQEVFNIRIALEGFAVGQAVEKIDDQQIEKILEVVQLMRRYVEVRKNGTNSRTSREEMAQFVAFNKRFHFLIAEATRSKHLVVMLSRMWDLNERYMNLLEFVLGLDDTDWFEHYEIAELIKNRDKTGAEEMMRVHIRRVMYKLTDYAKQSGWMESSSGTRTNTDTASKGARK